MASKIEIKLVGVDSRTEAALKLIFSRGAGFSINNQSAFALIDADSMNGREYIATHLKQNDVLITVMPDKHSHAYVVKKPINADILLETIKKASQDTHTSRENNSGNIKKDEISINSNEQVHGKEQTYEANPFAKFSSEAFIKKHAAERKKQQESTQEKLVSDAPVDSIRQTIEARVEKNPLFSNVKTYAIPAIQEHESNKIFGQEFEINLNEVPSHLYYETKNYLYRYMVDAHKTAIKEEKNVVIELDNDYIYFDLSDKVIYTSLPEGSLYALSLMPVAQGLSVSLIDNKKEMSSIIKNHRVVYYSQYGWLITLMILWSARGRIPNEMDVSQEYYLIDDHDLFLGGLQLKEIDEIKAFWKKEKSCSLQELTSKLALSQHILFSFFAVVRALELLTENADEAKQKSDHMGAVAANNIPKGSTTPSAQELLDKASHDLDALLKELQDI